MVCPDLERFAPVIEAVFGPSADDPSRHRGHVGDAAPPPLRYRIADRSIRDANPVLAATTAMLDLVAGRFDAPSVLDFVSLGPVRERFRFSDDDRSVQFHACHGTTRQVEVLRDVLMHLLADDELSL